MKKEKELKAFLNNTVKDARQVEDEVFEARKELNERKREQLEKKTEFIEEKNEVYRKLELAKRSHDTL